MLICEKLKNLRSCQRKLLPAIQTTTDLDIVLEVGCAQESRRSLGTKGLFAASLGAPATISRRLERLKKLGIVEQRAVSTDARRRDLVLSASFLKNLRKLVRLYERILSRSVSKRRPTRS